MFTFLARLIVFLIAISAIRSVVNRIQRLWHGVSPPPPPTPGQRPAASGKPYPATQLQQDPVCGTYLTADTSLKKIVGGRVIHFCSQECRERYSG